MKTKIFLAMALMAAISAVAFAQKKRIDPSNPSWSHKVDSLDIDFPYFPIIQPE